MFARARRQSRVSTKKSVPVSPAQGSSHSNRSDLPALQTPQLPASERNDNRSSSSGGPPVLPPIPRIASTRDTTIEENNSELVQTEAIPVPVLNIHGDNTDNFSLSSRKSGLKAQRSYEHFSRPRSTVSHASEGSRIDHSTLRPDSPALSTQRSRERLALRDNGPSSAVLTTYITQDPMFPRSASVSPLIPRFAGSTSSTGSRDSLEGKSSKRVGSNHESGAERRRKSERAGRAVTGPTTVVFSTQYKSASLETAQVDTPSTYSESPKMEASMFPTFSPATSSAPTLPQPSTVMDRTFIDSRDRPYSQAKPQTFPGGQPATTPNFARPSIQATHNTSAQTSPPASSPPPSQSTPPSSSPSGTIGRSFESMSAAFPAPQLVTTRPKNVGAVSTIAGVRVPTHHTSALKPQDSVSSTSKAERRRTKLINPMALLGRRKSTVEIAAPDDEERRVLALAQARQRTVTPVGIDALPTNFDPRIKGKIVHDFSTPRAIPRRIVASPDERPAAADLDQQRQMHDKVEDKNLVDGLMVAQTRKSARSPVFLEHLNQDETTGKATSLGGVGAEHRENKDFLARFSQQSSGSRCSQESAVLPPFARRSQNLDPAQAAAWRDDDASWSSGRDSGGGLSSTTGPPGDRESGISTFSAVSPVTRSSDSVQSPSNHSFYMHDPTGFMGGFSPISPQFDLKLDYPDRPTSSISTTSDRVRPRSLSETTTRPLNSLAMPITLDTIPGSTSETPDAVTPSNATAPDFGEAIEEFARNRTPLSEYAESNTSPRSHPVRPSQANEMLSKRKSTASRFSFQMNANDGDEEKALEDKFRESGVFPNKREASIRSADYDEDDYFDEDAINDMDEIELQLQHGEVGQGERLALAEQQAQPIPAVVPAVRPQQHMKVSIPDQQRKSSITPSAIEQTPLSASDKPKSSLESYGYATDVPYIANERELTYAEHPVFQAHRAFADSRRESYQSAILDSYLASSPTSPQRTSGSRQSSLTNMSPGRAKSRQSSLPHSRQQIETKLPLAEQATPSPDTQSVKHEATTAGRDVAVDSALGSFTFDDSAKQKSVISERSIGRTDGELDGKPRWDRTANLWRQLKVEDLPAAPIQARAISPTTSAHPRQEAYSASRQNDNVAMRGAYVRGVRVRKPTGNTRQSRLSISSPRLPSIEQQNEDIYYDDGHFDQTKGATTGSYTDEAKIDQLPLPHRYREELTQKRDPNQLDMIGMASDGPYPALPAQRSDLHKLRNSALLLTDLPLLEDVDPRLIPQRNPSEDAKRLGLSSNVPPLPLAEGDDNAENTQRKLQAYHQALADAANRAEFEGRFVRRASSVHDSGAGLGSVTQTGPMPDLVVNDEMIRNVGSTERPELSQPAALGTPGKMTFDFGFDETPREQADAWMHGADEFDDDIVAAANAEALAQDTDGFYGSEFGFYANARPGAELEVAATNGGYFGNDGDDGLTRKRSVKEPNLTPITERSEFSTRNSFISLGGPASSNAQPVPTLSRIPIDAFDDSDIITFEQLRKLRQNAFGSSNASLSSPQKSSPTSQLFPGSVLMPLGHSNGSSSSSDRLIMQEGLSHIEQSSKRTSFATATNDTSSRIHSRTGSRAEPATYSSDVGQPRWMTDRRRTSEVSNADRS